jgi:transcriptional regulator with XRE-family HTH domain
MATRWDRYYERQLEDPRMRELVERELVNLRLGAEIARIRQKRHLSQTQLAARAGMSASKISAIESSPKNVELATLIRIALALGYQFKPEFVPERASKRGQLRLAHASA